MKVMWLLGWAVPEAWFAPLARRAAPDAEHGFVASSPEAVSTLEAAGPVDHVVGHSLGSLLLLADAERVARVGRVSLLSPILAFPFEAGLGGRVAEARLHYLARWLRREPAAALANFYRTAGLPVPPALYPVAELPNLQWGLERLLTQRNATKLPTGWQGWCGTDDSLLDAARLHELEPRIRPVAGATHHPATLARAWAAETLADDALSPAASEPRVR